MTDAGAVCWLGFTMLAVTEVPSPVDDGGILDGCRIDGAALDPPSSTMELVNELPPACGVGVGIPGRMAPEMESGLAAGSEHYVSGALQP
jgi:hypothetical protein